MIIFSSPLVFLFLLHYFVVLFSSASHPIEKHIGKYNIDLSSYDDKILVNTVFGTGRAATTDSTGIIGDINRPTSAVYSRDENYLYITDLNGGGVIRKLAVTKSFASPFSVIYSVKTVFIGKIVISLSITISFVFNISSIKFQV